MSRRRWLRRRPKAAPKLRVSTHLPWRLRIVRFALLFAIVGSLALWTYNLGRGINVFGAGISAEQAHTLKLQMAKAQGERDHIAVTLEAVESQLAIERAAHKQLAAQVQSLTSENARMEEDLAFFDSLLPVGPVSEGVSIRRLKMELLSSNQFRYRLLIMRRGNSEHDFAGSLALSLTVVQDGKPMVLNFPGKDDKPEPFRLEFRRYQRIEGILTLPEGAQVKNVQARVLENGKLRAQQSANM
jgi:hypothetical protein